LAWLTVQQAGLYTGVLDLNLFADKSFTKEEVQFHMLCVSMKNKIMGYAFYSLIVTEHNCCEATNRNFMH